MRPYKVKLCLGPIGPDERVLDKWTIWANSEKEACERSKPGLGPWHWDDNAEVFRMGDTSGVFLAAKESWEE